MQNFHLSTFCFVLRFISLIMPSYSRNSANSGSDIYLFQLKNPWVKRSFRGSKNLTHNHLSLAQSVRFLSVREIIKSVTNFNVHLISFMLNFWRLFDSTSPFEMSILTFSHSSEFLQLEMI